MNSAIPDMNIS